MKILHIKITTIVRLIQILIDSNFWDNSASFYWLPNKMKMVLNEPKQMKENWVKKKHKPEWEVKK